jgi:hypothetical protein
VSAAWVKIRAQYNAPVAMGMAETVDHIVAESSRRRSLYQENCRHLHKVVDKIESEARLFGNSGPRARGPDWVSAASWVRNVFEGIACILACYGHCVWSGLRTLKPCVCAHSALAIRARRALERREQEEQRVRKTQERQQREQQRREQEERDRAREAEEHREKHESVTSAVDCLETGLRSKCQPSS